MFPVLGILSYLFWGKLIAVCEFPYASLWIMELMFSDHSHQRPDGLKTVIWMSMEVDGPQVKPWNDCNQGQQLHFSLIKDLKLEAPS